MKSLSLSKPHVLVMVGFPGSGKSFFADKFAEMFNAPLASREKIAATLGHESKEIEDVVLSHLRELLKTKQSIVVDGIGDTRAVRGEILRKAHEAGYEVLLVWVQTDPATAKSRSAKKSADTTHRHLSGSEYDSAAKRFTPPNAIEKPVVISGKHTYATQAKVVLKKLTEPRASISRHVAAPIRTDSQPPQPSSGRRNVIIR